MTARRRALESLAVGAIGGTLGVGLVALVAVFVPWLHMTWGLAAIMIPFNAAIGAIHLERKQRRAERLRLAPARALRTP